MSAETTDDLTLAPTDAPMGDLSDLDDVPEGTPGKLYTLDRALTAGRQQAWIADLTAPFEEAPIAARFGPGPYRIKCKYIDPETSQLRQRTCSFPIGGIPASQLLAAGQAPERRESWLEMLQASRNALAPPAPAGPSPELKAIQDQVAALTQLVQQQMAAPRGPDPMQAMMAGFMTQMQETMLTVLKAGPGGNAIKDLREQIVMLKDLREIMTPAAEEADGMEKLIALGSGIVEGLQGAQQDRTARERRQLPAGQQDTQPTTARRAAQPAAAAAAVPDNNPAPAGGGRSIPPEVETIANAIVRGLRLATADTPDPEAVEEAARKAADCADLLFPEKTLDRIISAPLSLAVAGTCQQVAQVRPGAKAMLADPRGKAFVQRALELLREGDGEDDVDDVDVEPGAHDDDLGDDDYDRDGEDTPVSDDLEP